MTVPDIVRSLQRWFATLKFKIVTLAVVTGVVSAMGTTHLVLTSMQRDVEKLLIANDIEDREGVAALLSNKLDMLEVVLGAAAREVSPELWGDPAAMAQFLMQRASASALFDSVLAAGADGQIIARLEHGHPTTDLPSIADREYFQRAMKTDQPVVSRPLLGRVTKAPLVIIAYPVLGPDGKTRGIVGGTLALRSTSLFSNLVGAGAPDGSRSMVMDREGVLLGHPNPERVLGSAADEPGLGAVFEQWHDSGSPIDTQGSASISQGHLVSMAGIPVSDWVLVRLTPQDVALKPIRAAGRTAWQAAMAVGLLAAMLSGALAWLITRPITALRSRADRMLAEESPSTERWPQQRGEVGDLAQAFQQVVEQRQRRQTETQALLQQLEAVLDHAEVGIALTRNGEFELVSRHFCRIFRCEKHQIVGQPTHLIHASEQAYQALSARALPAFMEHGVFDGEIELVRRTGQAFWAQMRGRAVVPGDRSKGTIWTIEDVTEVREHRERLAYTSSHDSLTGLCNRAAFEVKLEEATARAVSKPFCALFIDLDRFKQVNDTGGHAAGDALLRDVAHRIAAQVRATDTVARLGGDEFAVLLHQCSTAQAQVVAEKIRSAVIGYELVWEQKTHNVGASIGLVPVTGLLATAAEVLRAADTACYEAKRQGRNCVALHAA